MKKNALFSLFALTGLVLLIAAASPVAPGLKVGDKAPDFKLKNVDGRMVSLAGMKDVKGYIVTFTCNTCPYAVMYEDRLIELHKKFAPKGYPVVAIQPNDPEVQPGDAFEKMQARATDKGFPFAYLFDEGQVVYPQYGASRTPEIYLLDKDLMVRYTGAIDDNAQDAAAVTTRYVENAIAALESGKNPEPSFVKAIGCTIKTKKK
ncbi:MAG: thioredoxin family protein [Saprospiraceae bacterium]|nr:thioredoxin family protein [Saprospiraceae bacterium]